MWFTGPAGLALQHVVEKDHRATQVVQHVADAPAHRAGHVLAVADGDRLHHRPVQPFVEGLDGAVGRLERVVVLAVLCQRLRVGGGWGQGCSTLWNAEEVEEAIEAANGGAEAILGE